MQIGRIVNKKYLFPATLSSVPAVIIFMDCCSGNAYAYKDVL